MDIRTQLTSAIKKTFGFTEEVIHDLTAGQTRTIRGLNGLIAVILDERTPPKVVAEQLEQIILLIKRTPHASSEEVRFNHYVQEDWYNRMQYSADEVRDPFYSLNI